MPTARKGECLIHASIAACVGATHWSKPWPVKSPGVDAATWAARAETVVVAVVLAVVGVAVGPAGSDTAGAAAASRVATRATVVLRAAVTRWLERRRTGTPTTR